MGCPEMAAPSSRLRPISRLQTIVCGMVAGRSSFVSRWRSESSPPQEDPDEGASLVISGSIRSPDENDTLSVELSILGTELAMHADGSELGRWDSETVVIRQIDATSFEFTAEGDTLVFLPDDPAAFGIIPFSDAAEADRGRRRGRREKRSGDEPADGDASAVNKKATAKNPTKTKRQSKRQKAARAKKPLKAKKPPKAAKTPKQPKPARTGLWLRTLDTARRFDLMGLDRVPVDVELRGREHEHSWDHRVASSSGLGTHVCTICGKIRR